jgi:hypothetical protein
MKFRSRVWIGRLARVQAGAFLLGAIMLVPGSALAEPVPPIKLALFDFELEDFSAGAGLAGSARDTEYLALATAEARKLVARSGRYSLIESSGVDTPAAKEHWLRNCDGCEATIAGKLGADQSFVGVVTRVSRTEYWLRYQIRDAKSGTIVASARTELRLGADYSWDRGARWLIEKRLLASRDAP